MRRVLLPALLLPLAFVPHAGAATAGAQQSAYLDMTVHAGGHDYDVMLLASSPSAATQELRVQVYESATGVSSSYAGTLEAGALTLSDAKASLHTTLAGLPLTITWTASSDTGAVAGGGDGAGGSADTDAHSAPSLGYTQAGKSADVTVHLGDITCAPSAFASLGYAVADGAADAGPLAAAFKGISLDGATCSDVTYTTAA